MTGVNPYFEGKQKVNAPCCLSVLPAITVGAPGRAHATEAIAVVPTACFPHTHLKIKNAPNAAGRRISEETNWYSEPLLGLAKLPQYAKDRTGVNTYQPYLMAAALPFRVRGCYYLPMNPEFRAPL